MAKPKKGTPCWYELSTSDPAGAARFYGHVLGWTVTDVDMGGFTYSIANAGDAMVAGMAAASTGAAPGWMPYFTVLDADKAAKSVTKAGGAVQMAPQDIPDTGRIAVLADPQGASFGILASDDSGTTQPFDPHTSGHGSWHELMTSDPNDAFGFYSKLFGWKPGTPMDMGPMGSYNLFRHARSDIGGMMKQAPGMPGPDHPFWLPYFATDSVEAAIARTKDAGGMVFHGPHQVPGGAFIMVGQDPQGALFALSGPK
ncbi:MAG: VOC family protein [Albidovulum sp.]